MKVSKKILIAGLAWIPFGLLALGHNLFIRPVLMGLPFGGVIAEIVFLVFFLPFAASISYAAAVVFGGVVLGILCVIVIACIVVSKRINTSWMEGSVRVPDTPQIVVTAIAGAMKALVSTMDAAGRTIRDRVTTESSETADPTELERVRNAYARGDLTDLEMEQQIETILEKNRKEDGP